MSNLLIMSSILFRSILRIGNGVGMWPQQALFRPLYQMSGTFSQITGATISSLFNFRTLTYGPSMRPSLPCTNSVMDHNLLNHKTLSHNNWLCLQTREFHAVGSKVQYLDFRHRFKIHHLRTNLLLIRRQKMKKHQRRKWRRKFKCLIAKERLKREIAKEKAFRVELLSMIRKAENFDPKEYALRKIAEINNKPKELTGEEKLEKLKELIRVNRYQVDYIKPKHRRADI